MCWHMSRNEFRYSIRENRADMNNNFSEIQTRREFFKNSFKNVLPFLAATALLSQPLFLSAHNNCTACDGNCSGTCSGTCEVGCNRAGCKGACSGSCSGSCDGSCEKSCVNTCKNMCGYPTPCGGTCAGTCQKTNTCSQSE